MRLLDNAYDFLNESLRDSIAAEQDSKAWKFAILNIVQSIELLLKERLYRANELFIYENIDKPARTVSLSRAISRLTGPVGVRMGVKELRAIEKAKKWRDQIMHFEFKLSVYEIESIYSQLFEFATSFHGEHLGAELHYKIDPGLWHKEAEMMEFFRSEFISYQGAKVIRDWPRRIQEAQLERTIILNDEEFQRTVYGDEADLPSKVIRYPCHDCAVTKSQYHVPGCDMEVCPRCGGQLITCGCLV